MSAGKSLFAKRESDLEARMTCTSQKYHQTLDFSEMYKALLSGTNFKF